jgi:DNA-binding LacI/PurR family transcriptional regulator
MQGTRASTAEQLKAVVQTAARKLNYAPPIVRAQYRGGGFVNIERSRLQARVAFIGIPTKPQPWFQAFIAEVEQFEQAEQIIVKFIPTQKLD